jgi:DNA-binding transcriptional LysR family regulator
MRVFSRVIEEGSFAGAARKLNLSAAVVTRLVADLEEHLGARLINRTTRRLALTDTGELYLERVRQILSEVEEAEALASAAPSQPRGHLCVLSPPAFAAHQIAKHLPEFRAMYPRVTLELAAPGPVETVDENCDVSILQTSRQPLDGNFVARLLARSDVIACASPEYLDRRGRPQHPDDLAGHDTLLPGSGTEITFHHGGDAGRSAAEETVRLVPPRPAFGTAHGDTMYAAALAGMGIAALPSFMVEEALKNASLERVLPQWRLLTMRIYAAIPARKYVPARTRAFIEFLVEIMGGEDRDPWLASGLYETPRLAVESRSSARVAPTVQ